MNRSIAVAAGTLAVCVIAFAVVFSPEMISRRTRLIMPEKTGEISPQKEQTALQKSAEYGGEIRTEQNKALPATLLPAGQEASGTSPHMTTADNVAVATKTGTQEKGATNESDTDIQRQITSEPAEKEKMMMQTGEVKQNQASTEYSMEEIQSAAQMRAESQQKVPVAMESINAEPVVTGYPEGGYNNLVNAGQDLYDVEGIAAAPTEGPEAAAGNSNSFTLEEITVTAVKRPDYAAASSAKKKAEEEAARRIISGQQGVGLPGIDSNRPMLNPEYVGRDKFEDTKPNPVKLVSEEPVSTFSIDVDTASYAFVRRALNNGYLPQSDSVRIEEMINYFTYDYPLPKDKDEPFRPTIAVFQTPWNANTRLLHVGIKGYDIVSKKKPRANLTFLIDVSGSMASEDKLPLLKNSIRMLVDTLNPDDTVAIVTYAGSSATELDRTGISEKGKILAAIDRLHAGGSTAGAEGIRTAYSLAEAGMDPKAVNRVILATDGDFNVGITDNNVLQDFIERKRKIGIYLSVLGFGQGNYNDELMQKLAQNGNGNAAYIDNLNEARKVLVDEAYGTLFTIAKDVKIQVEFNPDMVSEYRLIGYETRQLNREDFRNDNVDAGDIGSGHNVTAIYEITPKGSDAKLIDDLRYGSKKDSENNKSKGSSSEYAFLKIRYKLPDETASREISTSIDKGNEYKKISDAPADSRFAAAVAAFGQLLRGDSYINRFTYDDVIALARDSLKDDTFGYRTEFLNLARLAKTASAMGDR